MHIFHKHKDSLNFLVQNLSSPKENTIWQAQKLGSCDCFSKSRYSRTSTYIQFIVCLTRLDQMLHTYFKRIFAFKTPSSIQKMQSQWILNHYPHQRYRTSFTPEDKIIIMMSIYSLLNIPGSFLCETIRHYFCRHLQIELVLKSEEEWLSQLKQNKMAP
jgi:hypothetical protein